MDRWSTSVWAHEIRGWDASPERIAAIWSPGACTDLRAIERETALSLLAGFRLRCGDYIVEITSAKNRRDAYR